MKNDELKKKIVEVLKEAMEPIEYGGDSEHAPEVHYPNEEQIADALIAAGIGDVKEAEMAANRYEMLYKMQSRDMALSERKTHEAEHRAEVAERALKNLAQLCAKGARYYLQSDKDVKERERELYDEWIKHAEKELAEEGKDE